MATSTKGPGVNDVTGRKREALQKQHADELKQRAEEISMAQAAEQESIEHDILDVTEKPMQPQVVDEVTVLESESDDSEVIRVAEDLLQVTIGRETYDFEAGRRYRVPKNVAFCLGEQGKLLLTR